MTARYPFDNRKHLVNTVYMDTNTNPALPAYDPTNEAPIVEAIRALVANGDTYRTIAKRTEGLNATDVRHLHDYGTCATRYRNIAAARAFRNAEEQAS